MKAWSRARSLAEKTPPHRERYLDFLRAAAILVVVFGHWLVQAPYMTDSGLTVTTMLGVVAWSHLLTWAVQVMPVFFVVGGYANLVSWEAAARDGRGYASWVQSRLTRLVVPVVPLLLTWAALSLGTRLAGVDPELIRQASRLALIPTWFLAVYVVVILLAPGAASAWRRYGMASFWLPVSASVLVDALAFGRGLGLEPGSFGWWLLRLAWLLAMALALLPVVALLVRFEQGGRERTADAVPPAAWTQVVGALLVGFGLAMLAGYGMSMPQFPFLHIVPLVMVLGGVGLVVNRRPRRVVRGAPNSSGG